MYTKLIFKNAKRSIKDYLIYLVTMTICVTLFYAFLSISSAYYHPAIGAAYDLSMLGDSMKLAICTIALLLIFLIRYVNRYMLIQRQKEFAVQAVLGMEQRITGWLFFAETLVMGAISVVSGILLGMVCSQFITAMLLADYGQPFQFTWMLFPDTVFLTTVFFACCFIFAGIFNIRSIQKIKIADMFTASQQNEPALSKSRFMHILTIFYLMLLAYMVFNGFQMITCYFDRRFALPVHLLFYALILLPALGILWPLLWLVLRKPGKKRAASSRLTTFPSLIAIETGFTLLTAISAAIVPDMKSRYLLSYGSGVMKQYLTFLTGNVLFLICELLYLTSRAIAFWKDQSPEHRYKDENLFFFGQILSRLVIHTKSMMLICSTLVLSVFLFLAAPVLTAWSLGYLDTRSRYDVQISSKYHRIYDEKDLPDSNYPDNNYPAVSDFLEDSGIRAASDHTFYMYLPERTQFRNRIKWEFPVLAISLSDYNAIRQMNGYEPVSLKDNTFTTQWQSIATDDQKEAFLSSHQQLSTDGGTVTLADHACYDAAIGQDVYNYYTDVIYVLPDQICRQLCGVNLCRYIQTAEPLSFADAQALESFFLQTYPDETDDGATASKDGIRYILRLHTLEVNRILATNFVLKAGMIYAAVTLMVVCLTILSLQQLMDASRSRYRFHVLHELGVEDNHIQRLIFRQLGTWFGIPVMLAILICIVTTTSFLQTISAEITAYIGIPALLEQLGITISILIMLLVCYFISTWILFRHSISR